MSSNQATTPQTTTYSAKTLLSDFTSSIVVFLVALPLCLGIALASGAPLFSGLLAGIIGGLVVGVLSGSHTSVSGPAAGLATIVFAKIQELGSFDAFLLAVVVGGVIQIVMGVFKAGALSAFFPSSVIKGLLAAIGVLLILKQIPHLFGHDTDPEGEMSLSQPDGHNTFSEIGTLFQGEIHLGAMVVGLIAIALMLSWDRIKPLKKLGIPGPLVVVLAAVGLQILFSGYNATWSIDGTHLVDIPVAKSFSDFKGFLVFPDFTQWANPAIYLAGVTIALVASLESLLNLEAVDKLDPQSRNSPPSRELWAQGVGNVVAGMIGAIPVTTVIVRGSVNVGAGAKTKLSAIFHGILLLVCVGLFPTYLNMIPKSALAAILIVTGFKLASPKLFKQMWQEGRYQFIPFLATLLAIVLTDLLIGVLIGLGISLLFILYSNLRRPIRRIVETHLDGDVVHIELPNQVSFLNRAALDKIFNEAPAGTNFLIDATHSDYIDPDILSLIREFKHKGAPARGVTVSSRGFHSEYKMHDDIQFADYSTRELQDRATPAQVLELLRAGSERFHSGNRISRDLGRQLNATAPGQNPLAVVLSCIDSRVPAEIVFDLGIGDIFSVRVAGNIVGTKTLGSIEYGVTVAGTKLVVVLGHTRCGAVTASVKQLADARDVEQASGCPHLHSIVSEVHDCIAPGHECRDISNMTEEAQEACIDLVATENVRRTVREIMARSHAVRSAVESGQAMVVGAMYDVKSGKIEFLDEAAQERPLVTNADGEQG